MTSTSDSAPPGSPPMWSPRTSAASPARQHFSSTNAAPTGLTTPPRSPPLSAQHGSRPGSARVKAQADDLAQAGGSPSRIRGAPTLGLSLGQRTTLNAATHIPVSNLGCTYAAATA